MILMKLIYLSNNFGVMWVKLRLASTCFALCFSMSATCFGVLKKDHRKVERGSALGFNIKEPADKQDWQFFMDSTQIWRKNLWDQQVSSGNLLADWSWTWRLAWLHVCAKDKAQWCQQIVVKSLYDRSLVVRAEAASVWGLRYKGTQDKSAAEILVKVFRLPSNDRRGKPLFVKKKILLAMKTIGGVNNLKLARALANTHTQMWHYWNTL